MRPRIPRQEYRPGVTAIVFLLYAAGSALFIGAAYALWGMH
jgi:hypothetical protein